MEVFCSIRNKKKQNFQQPFLKAYFIKNNIEKIITKNNNGFFESTITI